MAMALRAIICTLLLGILLSLGMGEKEGEEVVKVNKVVATCSFGGDNYTMGANKANIRRFLEENGGLGLQVILPKGGFMCAKNMEDKDLNGLVEYLEVVRPILRREKNKVWAIKREKMSPDGWTILENERGEDITLIKPFRI